MALEYVFWLIIGLIVLIAEIMGLSKMKLGDFQMIPLTVAIRRGIKRWPEYFGAAVFLFLAWLFWDFFGVPLFDALW